jgi:hypothetical protein
MAGQCAINALNACAMIVSTGYLASVASMTFVALAK